MSKSMNILLVVPPYRTTDALVASLYPQPYGLVMLAAVLEKAGHTVTIKDFLVPAVKSTCEPPASYEGKGAPPRLHYGEPLLGCEVWLAKHVSSYDVVGLACGQCNIWDGVAAVARAIKDAGKPLVIGGPFVTTATEQAMRIMQANVAVVGEGELVVERAMLMAVAGRRGVVHGAPVVSLGALPLPAWHLAPPTQYPEMDGRVRGVLAVSRGCPHACGFCSVHTIMSRTHRRQSTARITEELLHLYRLGVRSFCFVDDNLFISEAALASLETAIATCKAAVPDFAKRARFYNEEGMEVRMAAKPGVVRRVAALGFVNIGLGLETMNAAHRTRQRKPYQPADIDAAVREATAAGVTLRGFYIVGFIGDTVTSVCEDIVAFGKLGMAVRPNNLKLYPGTATTAEFRAAGLVGNDYDWRLSSWWTPTTGTMTYKQIKHCKTYLGAVGFAAESFGVRVFADSLAEVCRKVNASKAYTLTNKEHGAILMLGNMFRPTPYRHFLELVLVVAGAKGAHSEVQANGKGVLAWPIDKPKDEVQLGIYKALHDSEPVGFSYPSLFSKAP